MQPIISPESSIESRIYRIRGQQVMLDKDLAVLYGATTKRLNEQVRRNIRRFPVDFLFQLTLQEMAFVRGTQIQIDALRSQNATLKNRRGLHRKYRPYAFTELGVAMLSSVLNTERAIQVNIAIMRAFVKLRHAILSHQAIARRVEKVEGKINVHETDIRLLIQDVRSIRKRLPPDGPITPEVI